MVPAGPQAVIVTGATGRIGRLVRLHGAALDRTGISVHWLTRQEWDLRAGPKTSLPRGAVLLNLAGVVRGAGDLDDNLRHAEAILAADRALRFRHVLHLSSAAVLRPGPLPLTEEDAPDPPNAYGLAKAEADRRLTAALGPRVTILRLSNIPGADALLGGNDPDAPVVLDPVPGQDGGPIRSWIGPVTLARVLLALAARQGPLPDILNLAQPGALPMAALLTAAGRRWSYGPARDGVIARVELASDRLQVLCAEMGVDLPPARAEGLIAELSSLKGRWP